jgi:predicted membrane channel-forming protein YqfA (hemolysin III family)
MSDLNSTAYSDPIYNAALFYFQAIFFIIIGLLGFGALFNLHSKIMNEPKLKYQRFVLPLCYGGMVCFSFTALITFLDCVVFQEIFFLVASAILVTAGLVFIAIISILLFIHQIQKSMAEKTEIIKTVLDD